jgi:hypothetical protein
MNKIESSLDQRHSIRLRIASWTLAAALLFFLGWVLLHGTLAPTPRNLSEVLVTSDYMHPQETTEAVCAEYGCVEAWTTDVGTFMRFDSERKAEYLEYVLGDRCRRNATIIVDFGDDVLNTQQKIDAINLLFPGKDWY